MYKRAGLLGWLLVLALGSGAVAQSPSPEATPLFAPDDMGLLLPRELGGVALTVEDWTGPEALAVTTDTSLGKMQDLLISLGKEPSDLRIVQAFTTEASAPEQYNILAVRVAGIAADLLLDSALRADAEARGQSLPSDFALPMQTINARSVLTSGTLADTTGFVVYAKGEVLLFAEGSGGMTMGELIAELP